MSPLIVVKCHFDCFVSLLLCSFVVCVLIKALLVFTELPYLSVSNKKKHRSQKTCKNTQLMQLCKSVQGDKTNSRQQPLYTDELSDKELSQTYHLNRYGVLPEKQRSSQIILTASILSLQANQQQPEQDIFLCNTFSYANSICEFFMLKRKTWPIQL